MATSPWVQRNIDLAQYANARGSQYEGSHELLHPMPAAPVVAPATVHAQADQAMTVAERQDFYMAKLEALRAEKA